MKKTITLFFVLMLVAQLFGCGREVEDSPPVIVIRAYSDEINRPPTQLSEEDAEIVADIIEKLDWELGWDWKGSIDYFIDYYAWEIGYHSDSGRFIGPERLAAVNDVNREKINNILKKYLLME